MQAALIPRISPSDSGQGRAGSDSGAGTRGFSVTTLPISQGAFSARAHKAAEGGNVRFHLSPEHPQVKVRPPVPEPWVRWDPVSISAERTRKNK